MTLLLLLVTIGSAVWVGFDAQNRDFSGHFLAKNTTQWVIGMLGLWIVAFPMYLFARDKAPRRAQPVAPPAPGSAAPLASSDPATTSIAPPQPGELR